MYQSTVETEDNKLDIIQLEKDFYEVYDQDKKFIGFILYHELKNCFVGTLENGQDLESTDIPTLAAGMYDKAKEKDL